MELFIEKYKYQINTSSKKYLCVLGLLLVSVMLVACDDRTVNVQYDVCSKAYDCDSAGMNAAASPIHFILPDNHKAMTIKFFTYETFGFIGDMTDATYYLPAYGTEYIQNTEYFDLASIAIDAINDGLDVAIAYYETEDSDGIFRKVAEILSGYRSGNYYFNVYDYEGNKIESGMLPVGNTTFIFSENVRRIDIYSYLATGELEYEKAGHKRGTVGYEDAKEIEDDDADMYVPNAGAALNTLPSDIPDNFVYFSGAGGWSNTLHLHQDGSFDGRYYDVGYSGSDGTYEDVGICEYSGNFDVENFEGQTYTLKLKRLDCDHDIGQTWIEDNVQYTSTEPYGVERRIEVGTSDTLKSCG